MNNVSKIGVFTSGGDAPGMNAAIRAVIRTATYYNKEAFGIYRGYEGMIEGEISKLDLRSVGNILQRGGTILKSARSKMFRTVEGRKLAMENLSKMGIDGLIAIGGDGTFTGLNQFFLEHKIPSICIPGTIDNDISGTDYTIGFDTATNTALEAIDKIRDTALSHNRLFFIEVMGRHSGYIAINCAIAGGAVAYLIPEEETTIEQLLETLDNSRKSKRKSSLVVVAEGNKIGGANKLAKLVAARSNYYDVKVTILGHQQRGGAPTYFDRVLASRMGVAAVEGILNGKTDCMVGIKNDEIVFNLFDDVMKGRSHEIDSKYLRLAKILSL